MRQLEKPTAVVFMALDIRQPACSILPHFLTPQGYKGDLLGAGTHTRQLVKLTYAVFVSYLHTNCCARPTHHVHQPRKP